MSKRKILLDTSVIVDFLRQKQKAKTWLYRLAKEDNRLMISILTYAELYSGKSVWQKKIARQELKVVLKGLEIIKMNEKISELGGSLRVKTGVDLIDAVIAATAIESKAKLATLNREHFKKIKKLNLAVR